MVVAYTVIEISPPGEHGVYATILCVIILHDVIKNFLFPNYIYYRSDNGLSNHCMHNLDHESD